MWDASEWSVAQKKFINEYVRTLLVRWADIEVSGGEWYMEETESLIQVYVDYARFKGWVSKKKNRLTATGFSTAAAFLKR